MSDLRYKDCYCHTCEKDFHHMGIARHRSAHRDRKENCEITFSDGRRMGYRYGTAESFEHFNRLRKNIDSLEGA